MDESRYPCTSPRRSNAYSHIAFYFRLFTFYFPHLFYFLLFTFYFLRPRIPRISPIISHSPHHPLALSPWFRFAPHGAIDTTRAPHAPFKFHGRKPGTQKIKGRKKPKSRHDFPTFSCCDSPTPPLNVGLERQRVAKRRHRTSRGRQSTGRHEKSIPESRQRRSIYDFRMPICDWTEVGARLQYRHAEIGWPLISPNFTNTFAGQEEAICARLTPLLLNPISAPVSINEARVRTGEIPIRVRTAHKHQGRSCPDEHLAGVGQSGTCRNRYRVKRR